MGAVKPLKPLPEQHWKYNLPGVRCAECKAFFEQQRPMPSGYCYQCKLNPCLCKLFEINPDRAQTIVDLIKGKAPRKQYNFNAEPDIAEFLDSVDNKTSTIHKALRLLMTQPEQPSLEERVTRLEQLVNVPKESIT